MFNRNEIWIGLVVGLLVPAVGYFILFELFGLLESGGAASETGLSPNFRRRTLFIVALALNLIPMNYYRRRRWELSMRGVVIATGVLALWWVVRFLPQFF